MVANIRRGKSQQPRQTPAEKLASGQLTLVEVTELARESALRTLTRAPKSSAELKAVLLQRGFPIEAVAPLIDRFEAVGLLDDAGFAAMIVRTRHQERGQARSAIAAELARRGIAPEVASLALAQLDDESERVAAERLAAKLLERTIHLDRQVRLRRVVSALGRKGYSPGLCYEIVLAQLS